MRAPESIYWPSISRNKAYLAPLDATCHLKSAQEVPSVALLGIGAVRSSSPDGGPVGYQTLQSSETGVKINIWNLSLCYKIKFHKVFQLKIILGAKTLLLQIIQLNTVICGSFGALDYFALTLVPLLVLSFLSLEFLELRLYQKSAWKAVEAHLK